MTDTADINQPPGRPGGPVALWLNRVTLALAAIGGLGTLGIMAIINADVIGLSALLTTTMPFMKLTIEAIKEEGLNIPVIVGGAPVSEDFANSVGANGYGDNAPIAVNLCKKLIAANKEAATITA